MIFPHSGLSWDVLTVSSRLTRNIAANLAGQSLLLLLGLVAVKFVFVRLGDDALGIIYFTLTLNTLLCAALDLGISSTTVRQVSAHGPHDARYVEALVRTAATFYWLAWGVLAIALWAAAPLLVTGWVNLTTLDAASATHAVRVLGIGALTALPRSLYASLFGGLQRMEVSNAIDVATGVLQQLGTVVLLASGGGLVAVVYWFGLCYALSLAAYLALTARTLGVRALRPGYSAAVVARNRRFSAGMTSVSILGMIHMHADKVIVSRLLPLGTLGVWGFAASVVTRVTVLTSAVGQAALPSLSGLFHRGDHAGLLAQYRKVHDLVCLATVPLFAAIAFTAGPLLAALFDRETAAMLAAPVVLLCVGSYMSATLAVPYVVTLAMGRPGIAVQANVLALVVVLPVTALLIWTLGLLGAGLASIVYQAFMYAYSVPRVCVECLAMPTHRWYAHVLTIAALALATYGVVVVVGRVAVPDAGILARAAGYAVATVAFAAGATRVMAGETRAVLVRRWRARAAAAGAGVR
jgi:O-antigen/teichoic acid export membrane protein